MKHTLDGIKKDLAECWPCFSAAVWLGIIIFIILDGIYGKSILFNIFIAALSAVAIGALLHILLEHGKEYFSRVSLRALSGLVERHTGVAPLVKREPGKVRDIQ